MPRIVYLFFICVLDQMSGGRSRQNIDPTSHKATIGSSGNVLTVLDETVVQTELDLTHIWVYSAVPQR